MTRRRWVALAATPAVAIVVAGAASLGWAEYRERQARRSAANINAARDMWAGCLR